MQITLHSNRVIPIFLVLICGILQAANNPIYEQRKNNYIDSAVANGTGNKMIFQAYRNVPVDSNQLNTMLGNLMAKSTSDFDIIQLIRILYQSNGQYDAKILPVLNTIPFWVNKNDTTRNYWSENHMIMWSSSEWLMHEKYGKPVDSTLRERIVHYLNLKNTFGYYEFNSSTYAPFSLSGLLNLYDFSQDVEIKTKAGLAAQKLLKNMLLFTNDLGVYYPVAGRNYPSKYFNPFNQNHSAIIYLLTGNGNANNFTTGAAFLATSDLEVDTVINSWQPVIDTAYYNGHSLDTAFILHNQQSFVDKYVFLWSAGGYFHPQVVSGTVQILNDSALWDQVDFSLLKPLQGIVSPSSAPILSESLGMASKSTVLCEANVSFFKHNSITLSSVNDFWKGKAGYQQYTCVANVGTSAVYLGSGDAKLNWEARNDKVQNTHLPYVQQKNNVALLMYRPEPTPGLLPAYFQNKDVALHWRDNEFDETIEDSLWLIGRQADRYVAVRRACNGLINGVRACPTTGGQSWAIVVGDSLLYGSFSNFKNKINQSQFSENWYYDSLGSQYVYFAGITVDTVHIEYAWGVDSVTTGIQPVNDLTFGLYPNPSQNEVSIQLPSGMDKAQIRIYTLTGKLMYEETIGEQFTVSTNLFANGTYVVELLSKTQVGRKLLQVLH
ncbi:MAG: T9SS type A sorting domain-containing protein [Chitinophagales bacterium]|nr:T9SS type A sorting domain-containing protein [Chitinophagales bacterium]